jgi:hypothetical protein
LAVTETPLTTSLEATSATGSSGPPRPAGRAALGDDAALLAAEPVSDADHAAVGRRREVGARRPAFLGAERVGAGLLGEGRRQSRRR